ncbi:MAG: ATP-binding protein [Verrucomicrobiota bacterium]|nr:ATP-binding protein [Verrucomicrobiota bacterium]
MRLAPLIQRQHPIVIFGGGMLLVLTTGFLDAITGYEVSLSILYGIPIYLVAWFISKEAGVLISLICGIVWWWASVMGGHPYPNSWLEGWETFVRIVFFIFIAIGAASLKREHDAAASRIALLEHTRRLEREIIEISEREQRRIGRDLHDGLCQYQAALACAAASLHDDLMRKNLTAEAGRANELAHRLREAVAQTRDLARGLVPVQMAEEGLASALQELATSVAQLQSIDCHFHSLGRLPVFQNSAATHLYRIAQEAINNATRHGKAGRIRISLVADDEATVLRIADNGVGISKADHSHTGMGLNIMGYRAKLAGGELLVQEPSEGGTTISCVIRAVMEEEVHERAA